MLVTLSSLPGKFKCSLLNSFFRPDGITPNSGLTRPNNTHTQTHTHIHTHTHTHTHTYIYIYIYIYIINTFIIYIYR